MEKDLPVIEKVQRFWDTNVSNWKIASGHQTGSREFFAEVERYRFEKLI